MNLYPKAWACIRQAEQILAGLEQQLTGHLGPAAVGELRNMLRHLVYSRQNGESLRLRPIW